MSLQLTRCHGIRSADNDATDARVERNIEADGSDVHVANGLAAQQPTLARKAKPPPPTAPKPHRQPSATEQSVAPASRDIKVLVLPTAEAKSAVDNTEIETESDTSDDSDEDDFEDVEAVQFMESIHHVLAQQDKELKQQQHHQQQQQQQQAHVRAAGEPSGAKSGDVLPGHKPPHPDVFVTADGDAGTADAETTAKDAQVAEAAAARSQLVKELGHDRFCGALYILIESRNHTNTKTVKHLNCPAHACIGCV